MRAYIRTLLWGATPVTLMYSHLLQDLFCRSGFNRNALKDSEAPPDLTDTLNQ